MPFGLQPLDLIVIAIVALIVFGPKRLPQIGRWIGKTFSEFRKGARDMADGFKDETAPQNAEGSGTTAPPGTGPGSTKGQAESPTLPGEPSANPAATSASFCTACGAANPADARFCNKCGTRLPV